MSTGAVGRSVCVGDGWPGLGCLGRQSPECATLLSRKSLAGSPMSSVAPARSCAGPRQRDKQVQGKGSVGTSLIPGAAWGEASPESGLSPVTHPCLAPSTEPFLQPREGGRPWAPFTGGEGCAQPGTQGVSFNPPRGAGFPGASPQWTQSWGLDDRRVCAQGTRGWGCGMCSTRSLRPRDPAIITTTILQRLRLTWARRGGGPARAALPHSANSRQCPQEGNPALVGQEGATEGTCSRPCGRPSLQPQPHCSQERLQPPQDARVRGGGGREVGAPEKQRWLGAGPATGQAGRASGRHRCAQ